MWCDMLVFFTNPNFMEFQVGHLASFFLFSTIDYFNRFLVNATVPQCSNIGPTLFMLYINDLDDVICDIAIYADDTTHYSKCDQASRL